MIRLYNSSDEKIIDNLLKTNFNTGLKLNEFDHLFVYSDECIKGFILISIMYERAELNYIFVDEKYRMEHIASELLEFMFKFLKEKKVTSITLEVSKENDIAIKLYNKFNFKEVAIRKCYYNGIDAILMMREVC